MANVYNSITDLFKAIANSIRNKTGETSTIIADDFPVIINNIITLKDGSKDGTATAEDIIKGKIAYVNGQKVTGKISIQENTEIGINPITLAYSDGVFFITTAPDVVPNQYIGENVQFGINVTNKQIADVIELTADKIVNGNTVLGIIGTGTTGIDTSDATATEYDIAKTKIAYVNGQKVTGVLVEIPKNNTIDSDFIIFEKDPNNSDRMYVVSSISSNDYIMRSGSNIHVYLDNSTIADKIGLTADKILKGNTILGIEGTATKYINLGSNLVKSSSVLSSIRYDFLLCNDKLYASPSSSSETTYYSTDGKTWVDSHILRINSVQYNTDFPDCSYIAGGIGNKFIYYSNDGITWTAMKVDSSTSSNMYDCTNAVIFFNDFYIIAGKYYNGSVYYGLYYVYRLNQTPMVISTFRKEECYFLETINGYLVTVTSDDKPYYSSNGTKWNAATVDTSGAIGFTKVTKIGNALYGIYNGYLSKTTDGTSWSSTQMNVEINKYEYANNVFVGSSSDGNMYYSSDGITWTLADINNKPTNLRVNKIIYNEYKKIWWIACDNALYWSNNDGKVWNIMADSNSKSLVSIGYVNTIVAASGNNSTYAGIYYIDDENYNYND